MKMINKIVTIVKTTPDDFQKNIIEHINNMQKEGLEVNIKYSFTMDGGYPYYSAFIMGCTEVVANEEIESDKN